MSSMSFYLLTVLLSSATQAQSAGEEQVSSGLATSATELRNQAKAQQLVTTVPSTTSTDLVCCNTGTALVVALNHLQQQIATQVEDGMPLWAIVILSLSVLLGVVGFAILVLFIVFSIKQKDQGKKKSGREKTAKDTNGVIPRLTDLDHSCTVIMDMAGIDSPHNEGSTSTAQPTQTSICLHTSDNRIIDVPLSADGYAIPCEATVRHSTAGTPNQSGSGVTNHDYEECHEEELIYNLPDSIPTTVPQSRAVTGNTRHTILKHQGVQRHPVPYAKVNLSLKKTKEQLTDIRNRLTSQESEISYADLDFSSILSPDLVQPHSPPSRGLYSDTCSLKLPTKASTIDYGELDRHQALLHVFSDEDSDSESNESEPESNESGDDQSEEDDCNTTVTTTL